MKQTSGSAVRTRAAIKQPPMAVKAKAKNDRHGRADGAGAESSRETRVHVAAYALYEARGCVDGHDLEDWLAAEAAVAREAEESIPAGADH
jgi:Protein of unknown function (DUF2934)